MASKTTKIEGLATFSNNGFSFDSGLPSDEPVVSEQKLKGTLNIASNGNVEFINKTRNFKGPDVSKVAETQDYKIRRTSLNYVISLRVPVVEKRVATSKKLKEVIPLIINDISKNRKEILDV